jgi:PqqD family protein of HPr-rel-A system
LSRFILRSFEPEAVVFDTASGDTHFLAPLALELFQIVQKNPGMTADEVEAALTSHLSIDSNSHLSQLMEESLASLRRIGLLETP